MIKAYQLKYLHQLTIFVNLNGVEKCIRFSGDSSTKGMFITSDEALQNALENHPSFNIKFEIKPSANYNNTGIKGPGKPISGTVTIENMKGNGILAGERLPKDTSQIPVVPSQADNSNPADDTDDSASSDNVDDDVENKEDTESTSASDEVKAGGEIDEVENTAPQEMAFENLQLARAFFSQPPYNIPKTDMMSYEAINAKVAEFRITLKFQK